MSKNLKVIIGLLSLAVVALVVAALRMEDHPDLDSGGRQQRLVRADSQQLSTSTDDRVTFVEFLDFECEACASAFPAIEELRAEFGDRITFVVRYFPLHTNSERAARLAEAAAEQGRFEDMYRTLFERQTDWGHSESSQETKLLGYAEELGLDMERLRRVYDDPDTIDRIERDQSDGRALGVTGTPSFFLNGEAVTEGSLQDLIDRINDLLDD